MLTRVIALFLAFVLLWSGISTIEAPGSLAQPSLEQQHGLTYSAEQATAHEGSVEHHHLDDLPAQAQNDQPTETPGLLPAPLKPHAHSLVMARPHIFVSVDAEWPFLSGPLRPPCSTVHTG